MKVVSPSPPLVEGEDYYVEGAFVVFTSSFHLRRGYCCGNGCRHCPYDQRAVPKKRALDAEDEDAK